MRRWTYTYRTSDGQRHSGEIEAESLDAAHAAIRREMGVKPIKVWAAGGETASVQQREVGRSPRARRHGRAALVAAVVLAAIAGGAWWWFGDRVATEKPTTDRVDARPPVGVAAHEDTRHDGSPTASYRTAVDRQRLEGSSTSYREIVEEVDAACEAYREASSKIDFELLSNYALVERVRDTAEFHAIIAHGREVVSNARDVVRRSFSVHYDAIPPSRPDDRNEAQRLYGLVMDELDAADERLESDECALSLLETNRGRWRVVKGMVLWDDPKLERQFRIFGRELSAGATRWERDFGRGRIESAPVALPSAPAGK